MRIGVFPLVKHYYDPLFDAVDLPAEPCERRPLTGIDWNDGGQLAFLRTLNFSKELGDIPSRWIDAKTFYFGNQSFESGDAELWYNIIRRRSPSRIIEVGSSQSTLLAVRAIAQNRLDDPAYVCEHICIEPYENAWLEELGVRVLRQRVETVPLNFFAQLGQNDILFIDSSHVIRPGGDVLFEQLHVLPTLAPGVLVHLHDVFSPHDYPRAWLADHVRLWNEQYLLEAFLTSNRDWRVLCAASYLHHNFPAELRAVCPYLTPDRQPASIYLEKIG